MKFILEQLYSLYEVPIRLLKNGQLINSRCELQFTQENDPIFCDSELYHFLTDDVTDTPVLKTEHDSIVYGIFRDNNGMYCVIGPSTIIEHSTIDLTGYMKEHHIIDQDNFRIFKGNIFKTANTLVMLYHYMTGKEVGISELLEPLHLNLSQKQNSENDMMHYQFRYSEQGLDRLTYDMEKKIMDAISAGNLDYIKYSFERSELRQHVGIMANTNLKQAEYMAISGITLFARAAIEGGVSQYTAYNTADVYMQKIARCLSEEDIINLSANVALEFVNLVRESKENQRNPGYIEQCKQYIIQHINKPFCLDDLAKEIGLNKCYLTNQFSITEGMSMKQYTNHERIRAAKNMLKYSDSSIPSIANYLCYNSQSHFSAVFKNITGTTPSAYRTTNKVNAFHS